MSRIVCVAPALLFLPWVVRSEIQLLSAWEGASAGEQFGIAVAVGGDADGDGRADLAVGSSTSDEAGENAGKVSIFLGRATPSATPDLVLHGAPGSFFGDAVGWAGDVDGDGYDDLLVGAFSDDEGGTNAGKAYLFLGGDPMDAVPDVTLPGPTAGAQFGRAVCGAGRLNGDAYDDFAVGAPYTANGTVYAYFGGNPVDGTPELVVIGAAAGDRLGYALAGVGNVDARFGDDLLVGAPRASPAHVWQGAAYLFSGGAGMDTTADWTALGLAAGDQFGYAAAGAGDVNGDGTPDLVIGAPYRNAGPTIDAGEACVFYGGASLDATADFTITGAETEEDLGYAVAGCGDVTGSGFGHVLAGAPGAGGTGAAAGRVVLSPGGNPPSAQDLVVLDGESADSQFGFAVAGGAPFSNASFTGSTRPDFAVGAWGYGGRGKAYVYGLPDDGTAVPEPEAGLPGAFRLLVSPDPPRGFRLRLQGRLDASVICVLTPEGRRVRELQVPAGAASVTWDGRASDGRPAAAGVYVLRWSAGGRVRASERVLTVR